MTVGYCTKIVEKLPLGLHQMAEKYFLSRCKNASWPFGHLSCTIPTVFETTNMNRVSRWWPPWKSLAFLQWGFCRLPKSILGVGLGACMEHTAEMSQFWATGVVSGASQHPKDVHFVHEFWRGTYSLGTVPPGKQQNFYDLTDGDGDIA